MSIIPCDGRIKNFTSTGGSVYTASGIIEITTNQQGSNSILMGTPWTLNGFTINNAGLSQEIRDYFSSNVKSNGNSGSAMVGMPVKVQMDTETLKAVGLQNRSGTTEEENTKIWIKSKQQNRIDLELSQHGTNTDRVFPENPYIGIDHSPPLQDRFFTSVDISGKEVTINTTANRSVKLLGIELIDSPHIYTNSSRKNNLDFLKELLTSSKKLTFDFHRDTQIIMEEAIINGIVDGDTISVSISGNNHEVRLLGIDCPEHETEPGGEASTVFLTTLLKGKQTIYLQKDGITPNKDQYGRLLRYVWTKKTIDHSDLTTAFGNSCVNGMILRNGHARSMIIQSPMLYEWNIYNAEKAAALKNTGMWQYSYWDTAKNEAINRTLMSAPPSSAGEGKYAAVFVQRADGTWIHLNKTLLLSGRAILTNINCEEARSWEKVLIAGSTGMSIDEVLNISDLEEKEAYDDRPVLVREDSLTIGDCTFNIPPTSIRFTDVSSTKNVTALRNKGSVKTQTGHGDCMLEIDLMFNGEEEINGIPVTYDPNSETHTYMIPKDKVYYLNGLRSLIAQFKKTPFLPIENEHININLGIEAVTLQNIRCTILPQYPNCLQITLTLYKFEWETYMPEEPSFANTFCWPMFRWYVQEKYLGHNNNESMEDVLLRPWKNTNGEIDLGFKTIGESEIKKAIAAKEALEEMGQKPTIEGSIDELAQSGTILGNEANDYKFLSIGLDQYELYNTIVKNSKSEMEDGTKHAENIEKTFIERLNELGQKQYYYNSHTASGNRNGIFAEWKTDTLIDLTIIPPSGGRTQPVTIVLSIEHAKKYLPRYKESYETIIKHANQNYEISLGNYNNASNLYNNLLSESNYDSIDLPGLYIQDMQVMLENVITGNQMLSVNTPTHQYLGSNDSYITINAICNNEDTIKTLQNLVEYQKEVTQKYREIIKAGIIYIENDLAKLFGIRSILLQEIHTTTVEGHPGVYQIAMSIVDFDITQKSRQEFQAIMGGDNVFSVSQLEQSGHDDVNENRGINISFEEKVKKINPYPDLDLPKNVDVRTQAEEFNFKGFGIGALSGEYADPDFYIKSTSMLNKKLLAKLNEEITYRIIDANWQSDNGEILSASITKKAGSEIKDDTSILESIQYSKALEAINNRALEAYGTSASQAMEAIDAAEAASQVMDTTSTNESSYSHSGTGKSFLDVDWVNKTPSVDELKEMKTQMQHICSNMGMTSNGNIYKSLEAWIDSCIVNKKEVWIKPPTAEKMSSLLKYFVYAFNWSANEDKSITYDGLHNRNDGKKESIIFLDKGKSTEKEKADALSWIKAIMLQESSATIYTWNNGKYIPYICANGGSYDTGIMQLQLKDTFIADQALFRRFAWNWAVNMFEGIRKANVMYRGFLLEKQKGYLEYGTQKNAWKLTYMAYNAGHPTILKGIQAKLSLESLSPQAYANATRVEQKRKSHGLDSNPDTVIGHNASSIYNEKGEKEKAKEAKTYESQTTPETKEGKRPQATTTTTSSGVGSNATAATNNTNKTTTNNNEIQGSTSNSKAPLDAMRTMIEEVNWDISKLKSKEFQEKWTSTFGKQYEIKLVEGKQGTKVDSCVIFNDPDSVTKSSTIYASGKDYLETVTTNERAAINNDGTSTVGYYPGEDALAGYANPFMSYASSCKDMLEYDKRGRLIRAFPTFQLFLVDEGRWGTYYRLWDNLYGYNAVTSIHVNKSRERVADTCYVSLNNTFDTLTERDPEVQYDTEGFTWLDAVWPVRAVKEEMLEARRNSVTQAFIKPGTRIHLRMGFGANVANLPVVFNGTITEINTGEVIDFIAQGDGIELTNAYKDQTNSNNKAILGGEPRNLIGKLLDQKSAIDRFLNNQLDWRVGSGVVHLGNSAYNVMGWGEETESYVETLQNVFTVKKKFSNDHIENRTNPQAVNDWLWLPFSIGNDEPNVKIFRYGKTTYDFIQVLRLLAPDYIAAVNPFELRSTLFYGKPYYEMAYKYEYALSNNLPEAIEATRADVESPLRKRTVPDGDDCDNDIGNEEIIAGYSASESSNTVVTFKQETKEVRKAFQQFRFYTSITDIIDNKIKASEENVFNNAIGVWSGGAHDSPGMQTPIISVDTDIYPEKQKTMVVHTELRGGGLLYGDAKKAQSVATSALADSMRGMYKGTMSVHGDSALKPWDLIYMNDNYNRMSGSITCREVTHSLTRENGFITTFTPDALVSISDTWVMQRSQWLWLMAAPICIETVLAVWRKRASNGIVRDIARRWAGEDAKRGFVKQQLINGYKYGVNKYQALMNTDFMNKQSIVVQDRANFLAKKAEKEIRLYAKLAHIDDVDELIKTQFQKLSVKNLKGLIDFNKTAQVGKVSKLAAGSRFAIGACIQAAVVMVATSALVDHINRILQARQALMISPLMQRGKEFSAAINGHKGCVLGEPPSKWDKIFQNFGKAISILGSLTGETVNYDNSRTFLGTYDLEELFENQD